MEESSSGHNKTLQFLFDSIEERPIGTVSIQPTSKEHLVRARSLLDELKKSNLSQQAVVSLIMKPSFSVYRVSGSVSVQNLALSSDQFSSSNIWIQSGPSNDSNFITAGWTWMVFPELYGDSRTRLFTFWTGLSKLIEELL